MATNRQNPPLEAEISGRHWHVSQRQGIARRNLPPGQRPGRETHVVTPHPDKGLRQRGWRLEWLFLALVPIFGCVALALLAAH